MFYVARKDGETARKQWALYKNQRANLDAVFIVTWNDWTEGTIVEPSVERGLQDVTIIEEGASGFKDLPSEPAGLPLPKRLFDLRKGYAQLVRLGFPAAGAKALAPRWSGTPTRPATAAACCAPPRATCWAGR